MVPLDGASSPGEGGDSGDGGGKRDGSGSPEPGSSGSSSKSTDGKSGDSKAGSDSPATSDSDGSSSDGAKPGRTESGSGSGSAGRPEGSEGPSGSPSAPGGSSGPSGPAKLSVGDPQRKPAADRWCEKVTVSFKNTGGSPVRSGTVTFGTHVIGALGVDWATIKSTVKLPAPIDAGKTVKKTWPVCVEAWRVPLGMHIETQDVSVKWE